MSDPIAGPEPVGDEWPWNLAACEACGTPAPGNYVRVGVAGRGSIPCRCLACGHVNRVSVS